MASSAGGPGAERDQDKPADQRYDNAYLFGAICPARGVGAAFALPYADTDMMQLHLDEISSNVAKGAHAVVLLDRAGWHITSKLDMPENITPIFLPSRTPEFRSYLGYRDIRSHGHSSLRYWRHLIVKRKSAISSRYASKWLVRDRRGNSTIVSLCIDGLACSSRGTPPVGAARWQLRQSNSPAGHRNRP
jgi:hypothetical protein